MQRFLVAILLSWTLTSAFPGFAAADPARAFEGLVPGEPISRREMGTLFGAGIILGFEDSSTLDLLLFGGASVGIRLEPPAGRPSGAGVARPTISTPRVSRPDSLSRAAIPAGRATIPSWYVNATPIPFASSF